MKIQWIYININQGFEDKTKFLSRHLTDLPEHKLFTLSLCLIKVYYNICRMKVHVIIINFLFHLRKAQMVQNALSLLTRARNTHATLPLFSSFSRTVYSPIYLCSPIILCSKITRFSFKELQEPPQFISLFKIMQPARTYFFMFSKGRLNTNLTITAIVLTGTAPLGLRLLSLAP